MNTERGRMALMIFAALALAGWLCGCAYIQNPATPHASAAISDDVTSASLTLGSVGEFTFVATHSRTADGTTTGTVAIKHEKETLNALGTGVIGLLTGLLAGGAGVP